MISFSLCLLNKLKTIFISEMLCFVMNSQQKSKKLPALFPDEIIVAKSGLNLPLRMLNTTRIEIRKSENTRGRLEGKKKTGKSFNKKEKQDKLRGKQSNNLESKSFPSHVVSHKQHIHFPFSNH
jgi:hypothetical protein